MAELSGGFSPDDPWEIARRAPPWLSQTRWRELGLPMQYSNKLEVRGLLVVADIAQLSSGQFNAVPFVGPRLKSELAACLIAAIGRGGSPVEEAKAKARITPLLALVDEALAQLPAQHRDVASRLMGWNANPESVAEIALHCQLSVQRIYRVERDVIALFRERAGLMATVRGLVNVLDVAAAPITVRGIADADTRLAGFFGNLSVAQYLLARLMTPSIFIIAINGDSYLSWIKQAEWSKLVRRARGALAQARREGGSRQQIEHAFGTLLPDDSRQFLNLLVCEAERRQEVVEGTQAEPRPRKPRRT